jgi:NADPH:quinone reductase-like Zn-dependent oxidoreductase
MVRSLGADHVIDYTKEDYTQNDQRYDLIVDNVGNHSLLESRRVLKPDGIFVIVGGPNKGSFIGPMTIPLKAFMLSPFVSQEFVFLLADLTQEDLTLMGDFIQAGKVTPVIDRRYRLNEVPEAIAYLEEGHARGKVIISLE